MSNDYEKPSYIGNTIAVLVILFCFAIFVYKIILVINPPISSVEKFTVDTENLYYHYKKMDNYFSGLVYKENVNIFGETSFVKNIPTTSKNNQDWVDHYDGILKSNFKITKSCLYEAGNCNYITYTPVNGRLKKAFDFSKGFYTFYANNAVFYIDIYPQGLQKEAPTRDILYAGGKMYKIYGFIYIDINGEKGPNRNGIDLFAYNIAQDGHLYPFYGIERAKYNWGRSYLRSNMYWRNNILSCGHPDTANVIYGGDGCAARIMENNWKADYNMSILRYDDLKNYYFKK